MFFALHIGYLHLRRPLMTVYNKLITIYGLSQEKKYKSNSKDLTSH